MYLQARIYIYIYYLHTYAYKKNIYREREGDAYVYIYTYYTHTHIYIYRNNKFFFAPMFFSLDFQKNPWVGLVGSTLLRCHGWEAPPWSFTWNSPAKRMPWTFWRRLVAGFLVGKQPPTLHDICCGLVQRWEIPVSLKLWKSRGIFSAAEFVWCWSHQTSVQPLIPLELHGPLGSKRLFRGAVHLEQV